jgi:hypothetical protein
VWLVRPDRIPFRNCKRLGHIVVACKSPLTPRNSRLRTLIPNWHTVCSVIGVIQSAFMESPERFHRRTEIRQVASLGQPSGESALNPSQVSPLAFGPCRDSLHDVDNVLAAVLTNAQVLSGKLPSYSRSKRYIHEIERSAQRARVLIKRLLRQVPADDPPSGADESEDETAFGSIAVPPVSGSMVVVANQGPVAEADESASALAAPAFCCDVIAAHSNV